MTVKNFIFKPKIIWLALLCLSVNLACQNQTSDKTDSEFISIFNGEHLDGWINHGEENWYVENGEIICESGPKAEYGYLSTEEFYDDFELILDFKQEANGNSGVFFRSTLDGTKITGWQVEVAPPGNNTGGIYESYGRGWLGQPTAEKDSALKMGEWNEMRILVIGDRVTSWLNGTEMISLEDEKIGLGKGSIALQIHDGGGIKVRWKNLRVRTIDAEEYDSVEWTHIFDGSSTDGWRAYNGKTLPRQWVIKEDALTFDTDRKLEEDYEGGRDIIYAGKEYEEFDLYLEWKLPEGGNSGIFYHLQDGFDAPWQISPEYQLLDDNGWEKLNNATLEPWQKAGADYAMHVANENTKTLHPAGEWNSSRIIYTKERVEHYLNGKQLLSFDPSSEDWKQRKVEGKWKDFPDYGTIKKGYIGLQDHDSPLWFRNIKIREL